MPNVIELRQERSPQRGGWWLAQWVTRFTADATEPDVYEAPFVVRSVGGREHFERVANMVDLVNLEENRLLYFDMRGSNGAAFFTQVQAGDVIRITGDDTAHWVETTAPYDDRDFVVSQITTRVNGTGVAVLVGGQVQLTGYAFTHEDVGRWVRIQGMTTSGFNGYLQILSVDGAVARTGLSVLSPETSLSATWAFRWVEIDDKPDSHEGRYFPERRSGLAWELWRDSAFVLLGTGGTSLRERPDEVLFRSNRWGSMEPTVQAALDFAKVVRRGLELLQAEGAAHGAPDGRSPVLTVSTIGS